MKRHFAMLMVLALALGLLAGCAQTEKDDPAPDGGKPVVQPGEAEKPSGTDQPSKKPDEKAPAQPEGPKVFQWVVATEATCLNPHDCNDKGNLAVVDKIGSGLYGFLPDEKTGRTVMGPVLAESEPVTTDGGTTWHIKVRSDAKWPDGSPINARTFEYSWKTGLDPMTMYSPCTNIARNHITIKNADAYYRQGSEKSVKWEDVGIKALDDQTLEIVCDGIFTATDVMRHFYMRYTFPVKEELYEKCYSADRTTNDYGTTLEKTVCSGPFALTEWIKGSGGAMEKNKNWVMADRVKLDGVQYREVADESTRLELFEKGESDFVELGTNGLAKYGEDPRVASYTVATIRELQFNHNNPDKPYLADPLFRKAIFYAIDRNTLAKLDGYVAAPFYFGVTGMAKSDGTKYRELPEAKAMVPENGGYDPAKAKAYFDQAAEKYGLKDVHLSLTYVETKQGQRTHSEYLMKAFEEIFDGRLHLDLRAYGQKQSLSMMKVSVKEPTNTWDLCWSSMGLAAEPFYPWKRAERYTSTNASRYTSYNDTRLDELVARCYTNEVRLDENKMLETTLEMEKEMYEQCASVPVLEETRNEMFSARVTVPLKDYDFAGGLGWGWHLGNVK